jgi:hypothetical protein
VLRCVGRQGHEQHRDYPVLEMAEQREDRIVVEEEEAALSDLRHQRL